MADTRYKKMRLVVHPVDVEYTSIRTGEKYMIPVYQECCHAFDKVSCLNWIKRQKYPNLYRIFVEEE